MKLLIIAVTALFAALHALCSAEDADLGVWRLREDHPSDGPAVADVMLIIEATANGGRKLTFMRTLPDGSGVVLMTVETARDGRDAPLLVDEKPCGQTWAVRKIDDLRATAEIKIDGNPHSTWKAHITADGSTLYIEYDIAVPVNDPLMGDRSQGSIPKSGTRPT